MYLSMTRPTDNHRDLGNKLADNEFKKKEQNTHTPQ